MNPLTFMSTMMSRSLFVHGALHNQEVVSYACVNSESAQELESQKRQATPHPFQTGHIYRLVLQAQDSIPCFRWNINSIADVTRTTTFEDLPEVFRDYFFGKHSPTASISPNVLGEDHESDDGELQQFLNELHYSKMDGGFEGS